MKDSVYTQLTEYITGNQNKFYRLAYSYLNNKEAALDAVQIPASGSRWRKGSGKIPITCISSPMKAVFRPLTKIRNFILMRIRIR